MKYTIIRISFTVSLNALLLHGFSRSVNIAFTNEKLLYDYT